MGYAHVGVSACLVLWVSGSEEWGSGIEMRGKKRKGGKEREKQERKEKEGIRGLRG